MRSGPAATVRIGASPSREPASSTTSANAEAPLTQVARLPLPQRGDIMPIIHVLSPRSPPAEPPLLRRAARRHRPRRSCDPLAAPSARSRTVCCREGPRPRRGGALAGRSPLTPVSARALGAPAHTQPSERDRHSGGDARRCGNSPADRRSPSPPPSGPRTPAGPHLRVPHIPRPPSTPLTLWDMSRRSPALLPWGFPATLSGPPAPPACTASCSPPLVPPLDRRRARLRCRPRAVDCRHERLPWHV